MKNITLSAPEELIEQARKQAIRNGSTLNEQFRLWLKQQASKDHITTERFDEIMQQTSYVQAGRRFTRQEMNER